MSEKPPTADPLSSAVGACEDCGRGFTAGVVAHYKSEHPGMPRLRWVEGPGRSFIACADLTCNYKLDASKQYKSAGKDRDPVDVFSSHAATHTED